MFHKSAPKKRIAPVALPAQNGSARRKHPQTHCTQESQTTLKHPCWRSSGALKLRSIIKHFPAVLLIFSAIAAFAVVVKGHLILKLFEDYLPTQLSSTTFTLIILGLTVLITAGVLAHFMRQHYNECTFQECAYCWE
jgi:hypothetical protein